MSNLFDVKVSVNEVANHYICKADSAIDIAKLFLLNTFADYIDEGGCVEVRCCPLTVRNYIAPVCIYGLSDNAVVYTEKDKASLETKITRTISSNDPALFSLGDCAPQKEEEIGTETSVAGGCENGACNINW